MTRLTLIISAVILSACVHAPQRPQYTPRLPCPDIEELSPDDTLDIIADKYKRLSAQYEKCRVARRVDPRRAKGVSA